MSFVMLKGSKRWLLREPYLNARVLYCMGVFSHACLSTLILSNSSLLWTKVCKTISTVTLFVLLIALTYAHICEISDMLSMLCHGTCACVFTFFSAFPWRVTYMYQTRGTLFHRGIQTPRRELKIRRAAEYFWPNSRSKSKQKLRSKRRGEIVKMIIYAN